MSPNEAFVALTVALVLLLLMVLLWPRVRLHRAALWFMASIWAVMLRWCFGALWPGLFGPRESLIAAGIFFLATLVTVAFAGIAWHDYLREAERDE